MTDNLEGGCTCGAVRCRLKAAPIFDAYYDTKAVWPAESLARRKALFG